MIKASSQKSLKLRRLGNCLIVTIPRELEEAFALRPGDKVRVHLSMGADAVGVHLERRGKEGKQA